MPFAIGAAILAAAGADAIAVGAGTLATSTILGVSTASVVGTVALGGAAVGAAALLSATEKNQSQTITVNQALAPRVRVYGRTLVGGVRCFMESRNGNLYQVIILASHEIDAVEGFYIGDIGVAVVNGLVQSAPWGRDGGSSYIGIEVGQGDAGQGPSAMILGAFPEVGGNFVQGGCARASIVMLGAKASVFTNLYPQAEATQFRFIVRGAKVYDPRDGSHAWKNNSGLCVLDHLTHGDGFRVPLAAIDLPSFSDFADLCDETVVRKDGNGELRYTANGTYTFDEAPKDVHKRLCATCDGQLVTLASGKIGIRGGRWTAPTVSIGTGHVGTLDVQQGAGAMAAYNRLTTSFSYGPAYYAMTEIAARTDVASQAAVGTIPETLALPMVTSYSQAARLAKIAMLKANSAWIVKARTDAVGLDAIGEAMVDFEFTPLSAAAPLVAGTFEVTALTVDLVKGVCDFGLNYVTADVYAWDPATEEPDAPKTPMAIADKNTIDPPANAHALIVVQAISGGTSGVVGQLTWDAPSRVDVTPVAQYRVAGSGDGGWLTMSIGGDGRSATTPLLQDGQTYDFEVSFTAGGSTSAGSVVAGVSAQVPPSAPGQFTASSANGTVTLRALAPQSANFYSLSFLRMRPDGSTAPVGADVIGPANSFLSTTDQPGAGTWTYLAVSKTAAGAASSSAPPVTTTV